MTAAPNQKRAVCRQRRWRAWAGLNVAISLWLAVVLVVLLNSWSARRYARWNLSRNNVYALSPTTETVLTSIRDQVEVLVLMPRGTPLFHYIENLLREYQARAPQLQVHFIDPDRQLARTEELARQFNVTEPNQIVFHKAGRYQVVAANEVIQYDDAAVRAGHQRPARLYGEELFTAALYRLTLAEPPRVYFLAGHGERRIDNYDPYVGYSTIAKRLRTDHIDPVAFQLGETGEIPKDAAALIVAGPNRRLAQPELDLIRAYLERSGRVMILLDALTQTGLEPLLAEWGVHTERGRVLDPQRTLSGRELFITTYGPHPITRPLDGLTSIFFQPRSVEPLAGIQNMGQTGESADRPHVTALALSSAEGWVERSPHQAPSRFDPDRDRRGPISVAVAVERGPLPGIEVDIPPTRLVVFGDSAFVTNGALTGGDAYFFMSALHWLLDRDDRLTIGTRTADSWQWVVTRRDLIRLGGWSIGGIPALALLAGWLAWLNRRR